MRKKLAQIDVQFFGNFTKLYELSYHMVLIKCRQPAKKPDTWRFEPSTFGGNMVSRGSENLKLPKKHNWQAVYFNILAVNCKT